MELITDFYKSLDTLNLIIFWGIIIVIILLLIFSFIMISKNKKLKKLVEENNYKHEEELPIKKEELEIVENKEKILEKDSEFIPIINEEPESTDSEQEEKLPKIESKFIAEEHVIEYNNTSKEEKNNRVVDIKPSVEMPTRPYQRNVLREMSLSQTSPIGINRQQRNDEKKVELVKDLEDSLNERETETLTKEKTIQNNSTQIDIQIKKELSNLENNSPRKTEIRREVKTENSIKIPNYEEKRKEQESSKKIPDLKYSNSTTENSAKELLNSQPRIVGEKSSSEKYLEEVSRKLAEAEIPDEIERTNYELQQEEDAIISYKELMEKKDSIQTIDEEDAIISIEELMNKTNQQQEEIKEESKLYNLTEEEENEKFIKELKQFRSDL